MRLARDTVIRILVVGYLVIGYILIKDERTGADCMCLAPLFTIIIISLLGSDEDTADCAVPDV